MNCGDSDICEKEKPITDLHTHSINICNDCVEDNHCMSIK